MLETKSDGEPKMFFFSFDFLSNSVVIITIKMRRENGMNSLDIWFTPNLMFSLKFRQFGTHSEPVIVT